MNFHLVSPKTQDRVSKFDTTFKASQLSRTLLSDLKEIELNIGKTLAANSYPFDNYLKLKQKKSKKGGA